MANNEILSRPSIGERGWLLSQLRDETVGGVILLLAAVVALVWANSPLGDSYFDLVHYKIGPTELGLHLSLGVWAADALLAIFFFVVGLELKHELVLGSLSKPAQAIVPAAAALGGMLVPALFYVVVNATMADGSLRGWGIPMATDIAFALAVLAVFGRKLPVALRAFLPIILPDWESSVVVKFTCAVSRRLPSLIVLVINCFKLGCDCIKNSLPILKVTVVSG